MKQLRAQFPITLSALYFWEYNSLFGLPSLCPTIADCIEHTRARTYEENFKTTSYKS